MNQLALALNPKRRPRVPYWPTTPLTREQMAGAIAIASQQDEAVLAIFRAHRGPLAPSQVHAIGVEHGRRWLLTSVRRSITNLTTQAKVLASTGELRDGPHGRPEHLWELARP